MVADTLSVAGEELPLVGKSLILSALLSWHDHCC